MLSDYEDGGGGGGKHTSQRSESRSMAGVVVGWGNGKALHV